MFDVSKVVSNLNTLVGWKQPTGFSFTINADNLLATKSRYYTDNRFVNLQWLLDTQPNPNITEVQFNDLLADISRQAIIKVMDNVFDEPDFIDRKLLYRYANNKIATDSLPANSFVGQQIKPNPKVNDLAFEITKVNLEFSNTGDITICLLNSEKSDVVFQETVSVTSGLQEVELGWVLNDTDGLYRGEYFLGYYTADTTLIPFKREYEYSDIESIISGIYTQPIYVSAVSGELFDLEAVENSDETWGLNPDFTVYHDYTSLILSNKSLFATAIQMAGQIIVMEYYISSNRSNREERIGREMLENVLVQLNGLTSESMKEQGLKSALSGELTRLKKEVSKFKKGYFPDSYFQSVTRY